MIVAEALFEQDPHNPAVSGDTQGLTRGLLLSKLPSGSQLIPSYVVPDHLLESDYGRDVNWPNTVVTYIALCTATSQAAQCCFEAFGKELAEIVRLRRDAPVG